jgi:hypothetical protein
MIAAGLIIPATAQQKLQVKETDQVQIQTKSLRTVAPNRGKLIRGNPKFTSIGGNQGVVCCTHWNTSTGGTGCATFPDQCPSDTFTVECGDDGCW